MIGLRQKLSLGFGGLLAVAIVIGAQSILLLYQLEDSIEIILRENYQSVIACQQMKEALDQVDRGLLFVLLGHESEGKKQVLDSQREFEKALEVELNNITIPGEGDKARKLDQLFKEYQTAVGSMIDPDHSDEFKRRDYYDKVVPLFEQVKAMADEILQMNQQNMMGANKQARQLAASARRQTYFLLVLGSVLAGVFIFFIGSWILAPVTRLIRSANEIKSGNLDLIVKSDSSDEIGQLSEAFNAMAGSLRRVRRTREAKLAQMEHTIHEAFNSLPEPIAVVDPEGKVEVVSEIAEKIFGIKPNIKIQTLSLNWILPLFNEALRTGGSVEPHNDQLPLQAFVNGDERYYWPRAVAILDRAKIATGVLIVLSDMTEKQQQLDLKRGVISTVSHELKSPLTSVRMAIHLLLDEVLGALTPQQTEVLMAAEQDARRLHEIVENLLDLGRIEAGKGLMDYQVISAHILALEGVEPFRSACQSHGINLTLNLAEDLPDVWVDPTRVSHVFSNLLSNAIKYTDPGGAITLSGEADENFVRFAVTDTGRGIAAKYFHRIFEQFFRIPDQDDKTGAGLGLAIARQIVEAHGGMIAVESAELQGSTFVFSLRRADSINQE